MTLIYKISDMQSRDVTENTCMKVVCLPYDNISLEIGYHESVNKWMSYILFVCLFQINIYHWMAPDSKNDKTLTLVKTHFMS